MLSVTESAISCWLILGPLCIIMNIYSNVWLVFVIKLLSLNIECRYLKLSNCFELQYKSVYTFKNHNSKNIQFIVNAVDTNVFNSCTEASPHYQRLQTKKIRYQISMFILYIHCLFVTFFYYPHCVL